jgi:hypothetical protein
MKLQVVATDQATAKGDKGFMYLVASVIPNAESSKPVEVAECAFDRPAMFAKAAAVWGISLGQNGFNVALAKLTPVRFRIKCAISLNALRASAWPTRFAAHRRNCVDQRKELSYIVSIGGSHRGRERNALSIGDEMMLGSRFAPIRRVTARFFPPCTARTDAESTRARDQSILSAPCKCASSVWWIRFQMPRLRQASNRRQAVIPHPHSNSFGSISHGMPERRMKIIADSAFRLSTGLRPGYRLRRFFGGGRIGSTNSHNASSRIGLAMIAPPCATKNVTHSR